MSDVVDDPRAGIEPGEALRLAREVEHGIGGTPYQRAVAAALVAEIDRLQAMQARALKVVAGSWSAGAQRAAAYILAS